MDLQKLQIDRGTSERRARRRGRWLPRIIVVVVLVGIFFLFRAPILEQVDRWRLPSVRVASIVRSSPMARAAALGTAANGYVVARRRAALSSDEPGRIVELNVEEGSVVKKGDVVARLYAEELEAALRRTEADLAAGDAAVAAAEMRLKAAKARLEETLAAVAGAEAARAEAEATVKLAKLEYGRSQRLLESAADTQERLDRAETALEGANARLAGAESELATARLAAKGAEADVAVAAAEHAQAVAALPGLAAARDLAKASLDKTFVRAPFDGVIVLKDAEVGEVVSPNAQGSQSRGSVATMVDFESLEIQVELPETSLSSVRIGAPAQVFLDAFPDERFDGRVLRIWPTANRQKATVEVRVGLERIDPRMRPDMGARVVFPPEDAEPAEALAGDAAEEILVPVEALVKIEGRDGVFVLERDVARFRAVALGKTSGRRAVVTDGLAGGERVVLDPPARLSDGDRVQVQGGS